MTPSKELDFFGIVGLMVTVLVIGAIVALLSSGLSRLTYEFVERAVAPWFPWPRLLPSSPRFAVTHVLGLLSIVFLTVAGLVDWLKARVRRAKEAKISN